MNNAHFSERESPTTEIFPIKVQNNERVIKDVR